MKDGGSDGVGFFLSFSRQQKIVVTPETTTVAILSENSRPLKHTDENRPSLLGVWSGMVKKTTVAYIDNNCISCFARDS